MHWSRRWRAGAGRNVPSPWRGHVIEAGGQRCGSGFPVLRGAASQRLKSASLVLWLFASSASAQLDNRCTEAAALWIPSTTSLEKVVIKWRGPLKYDILPRNDSAEIRRPIEDTLQLFSKASGLAFLPEQRSEPDLAIMVVPDLAAAAPSLRKPVEDFFTSWALANHVQGRMDIDPAQWEAKLRTIVPRCGGLDLAIRGTIVRAFSAIQRDELAQCVNVELGELFGLISIRKYYSDRSSHAPADVIEAAVRSLYNKEISPGIGENEAAQRAREVCK
jgi:hypothetical protein